MTIQKDSTASKQKRLPKRHEQMTEKDEIRAALYVTLSDEQLERAKVNGNKKQGEMTPQEFEDFSARCDKRADEARERARALQLDYVGETIKLRQRARANAIARNQIVKGDEVRLKQKITAYRGQDIVPLPDWVLAEGLYGRVENPWRRTSC